MFAFVETPLTPGEFWGWIGTAFGCIGGGFGSAAGSYNTYRQMAGAEDLLKSPRTTWFDWVLRGYLLLGIVLIVAGLWDFADGNPGPISNWPLFLLGGIATFQAGLFLIWRTLVCLGTPKSAPAASLDPRREAIRRRVAGPAIGLIVVGLLGLVPALLMTLITPTVVMIQPSQPPPQPESPFDQKAGAASEWRPNSPVGSHAAIFVPALALNQSHALVPLILAQPQYDAQGLPLLSGSSSGEFSCCCLSAAARSSPAS